MGYLLRMKWCCFQSLINFSHKSMVQRHCQWTLRGEQIERSLLAEDPFNLKRVCEIR